MKLLENRNIHTQQITMAHAQSKMIQEEYYEEKDNYVQDKLVLYIEEIDINTSNSDMRCFIIFDEYENEFLITGMRKEGFVMGEQYTFYCKKRKNVLNYLKSILDPKNEVKIILYNYSNLNYKLNFKELYSLGNSKKELVGYDDVSLLNESSWKYIKMHLKNLLFVRY
jgi:hypothetical protein